MAFNLGNFAGGLGSIGAGYDVELDDRLKREELLSDQAATILAGRAFQGLVPGASPLLSGQGGPGSASPAPPGVGPGIPAGPGGQGAGPGIPGVQPMAMMPNAPPSGAPMPPSGNMMPPGGGMGQGPAIPGMPPGFAPGPAGPPNLSMAQVAPGGAPGDPMGVMRPPTGIPPRQAQPAIPQQQMMPQPYGGGPPPGMMPPGPPMGGMRPQGPMPGIPAQQGPQRPQGVPQSPSLSGGQFDWRQIVQSVVQQNSGAPPQVIAKAVSKLMGWMNPIAQQEWREISAQLNYQAKLNTQDQENERLRERLRATGEQGELNREARAAAQKEKEEAAADKRKQEALDRMERLRVTLAGKKDAASQKAATDLALEIQKEEARSGLTAQRIEATHEDVKTRTTSAEKIATGRGETAVKVAGMRGDTAEDIAQRRITSQEKIAAAREAGQSFRAQSRAGRGAPQSVYQQKLDWAQKQYQAIDKRFTLAQEAVDAAREAGYPVTGVLGKIQRGTEFVVSASGLGTGTEATKFKQYIDELLTIVPRVIAQRGVTAKDERARWERIIGGTSFGDTSPVTTTKLREIQDFIRDLAPPGYQPPDMSKPGAPVGQQPAAPAGPAPTMRYNKETDQFEPISSPGGASGAPFDKRSELRGPQFAMNLRGNTASDVGMMGYPAGESNRRTSDPITNKLLAPPPKWQGPVDQPDRQEPYQPQGPTQQTDFELTARKAIDELRNPKGNQAQFWKDHPFVGALLTGLIQASSLAGPAEGPTGGPIARPYFGINRHGEGFPLNQRGRTYTFPSAPVETTGENVMQSIMNVLDRMSGRRGDPEMVAQRSQAGLRGQEAVRPIRDEQEQGALQREQEQYGRLLTRSEERRGGPTPKRKRASRPRTNIVPFSRSTSPE